MKLALVVVLLVLSVVLMAAFLFGASALDQDLSFGLNLGVVAAAASLIIAAIGPALLVSRLATKVALVTAAAWLPASIALAGGFQLSLSGWRSIAWLVFTCLVLLAILVSWIIALMSQFRSRLAA